MALKEGLRAWKRIFWRLILLAVGFSGMILYGFPAVRHLETFIPMGTCPLARMPLIRDNFTGVLHLWARPEVLTCTSWGAPIIWDGTFDPDVAQQEAIQQNLTIGLTVFAVGRGSQADAEGKDRDRERGLEARWHDESHLNKYFWLHKPAKVLSPEFCWSPEIGRRAEIRHPRLLWAPKEYAVVRN
ncbi:PREDICTED: alpha 1,3-galactosyltransferase 2 [Miniopterus natalensis]|uniref:alpha 1,3-galactosyltransferase 2 n=1 Tax=Miniopterus natalensis TaxID=291302 RepID=UPI0007A6DC06|nr:PREDICTED: alpha 1,3-galactosyltransferase 2 [Miniopterus natalensis]